VLAKMKPSQAVLLRDAVQGFVRTFGLLAGNQTPCGQPLQVSEAHALMAMLAPDEDPTLHDLGQVLGIDKSNVSRLCARLQSSGLIASRTCKRDRRAKRLELTAKGRRLAADVESASRKRFAAVLAALPVASIPGVVEALRELTSAIRQTSQTEGTE